MRIYNSIIKILLGILIIVISSCSTNNSCIKTFKDSQLFKEYIVNKDTCNIFENKPHLSYYLNDTLIMSGFGNRLIKEGLWKFYNNGEIITSGVFKNANPEGKWNYKNFGDIDWEFYKNKDGNYVLSLPKNWKIVNLTPISMEIVNDTILDNFDVKIVTESLPSDISFDELYSNISTKFKKEAGEYFKIKKWIASDEVNTFVFEYKTNFSDGSIFKVSSRYYKFNDQVYSISIYIRDGLNYAYDIIEEQIMWSFKINETLLLDEK